MSVSHRVAACRLKELQKSAPFLSSSARLASFKRFNRQGNATCTSQTLARAGFVSSASRDSPNSAKCPFCRLELEFKMTDDPWVEHKKHSPKCEFVKMNKQDELMWTLKDAVMLAIRWATNEKYQKVKDVIRHFENQDTKQTEMPFPRAEATKVLLGLRDGSKYLTYSHRLESFGKLEFDKTKGAACTSTTLAYAGWYKLESEDPLPLAKCPFCLLEMEFEMTDDPWIEHKKHSPNCDFVTVGHLDDKFWTKDEGVQLAVRSAIMGRYETGIWLVEEMEREKRYDKIKETMEAFIGK